MNTNRWLSVGLAGLVAAGVLSVRLPAAAQGRGAAPPPTGPGQGRGGTQTQQAQQPQKPPPPLVTTGLIVGRVVDAASGQPVAGATVTLQGGVAPAPPVPVTPGMPRPASAPPAQPPRFLTDGEGRFAFRNLTRGNFSLTANKPGYSDGAYGRFRPGGPSRSIQLDDNEKVGEITVRVFKMAIITGAVVDEAGEPVVGAQLRSYRRVLQGGRRVLTQSASVTTDDRGVYRFTSLTPGEYIVSVPIVATSTPAGFTGGGRDFNFQATANTPGGGFFFAGPGGRPVTPDGRFLLNAGSPSGSGSLAVVTGPESGAMLSYATQYYSTSSSASQATVIKVGSGEERSGVDFVMRLVPITTISGVLLSPEGLASNYVLHLVPSEADSFSFDPDAATAVTDENGSFMFLGIPAGQYIIQTTRQSEGGPAIPPPPPPGANIKTEETVDPSGRTVVTTTTLGANGAVLSVNRQTISPPMLWTAMPIAVGETGIDGISLTLRDGFKISGRVEFSGSAERPPAARLAQIPIVVEPADGRQRTNFQPPTRVAPDGTFTVNGLLPGQYYVRVGGPPGGWVTQAVMLGGVDVSDIPLQLGEKDITGVVATFTDRITDLKGTVRGLKEDAEPAAVIVFPSDTTAWKNAGTNPRRMRMVRATQTGSFSVGAIPAGDYYIIAVPDEFSGEWSDPAYLEVLTRVAIRMSISDGERKVQEVEVQNVRPPGGGPPSPFPTLPVEDCGSGPFVSDAAAPPQVRDRPLADPIGKGSISGVVVEDGTNRPVRRARVTGRAPELRNEVVAFTDDQGRFVLPKLAPGAYTVSVSKPAYLSGFHGATRPGRGPGVPVPVREGQQVTGITVGIARGGVISGIVMDQFGQPYSGGRIRLMQAQRRDGERVLTASGGTGTMTTDDRGVYRIYGLMPGTYAVGIIPAVQSGSETRALSETEMRAALTDLSRKDPQTQQTTTAADGTRSIPPAPPGPVPVVPPSGRALGLATVFYPGTVIDTEAQTVSVAAGQEVGGIDFTLMFVPTARIEGSVVMPDGQPAGRSAVQITSTTAGSTTNASVRILPDGKFQAVGVSPGRYSIIARMVDTSARPGPVPPAGGIVPPTQAPGATLWAIQDLHVNGEDLTGLVLTLAPTSTISGRVILEGGSAGTLPEAAVIRVSVDVFGTARPGASTRFVNADKSGTFSISAVTPGLYRMSASIQLNSPNAPAWTVRSAVLQGQDVYEQTFEVTMGRDYEGATVTLTDKAAELSGSITDGTGAPIPNLYVMLFPTDRNAWSTSSRRMRGPARTTADGTYRVAGVRPGEYYLGVVREMENGDWGDPGYMEQVAAASLKIVFAEGEKKVQNLRGG